MEFVIGGGVGEHGRNCFFVQSDVNYIVDCGVMKGEEDCYPRLDAQQICSAEYLFLTHSHEDHIGAFRYFLQKGFRGKVVGSWETLQRIGKYDNAVIIHDGEKKGKFKKIDVECGRSGHCVGSLWFHIRTASSNVLFSGDYCENSCYIADKIENRSAQIAVLDSAFGNFPYRRGEQEIKILQFVQNAFETGDILLPVPQNGRAIDLVCLLQNADCNILADETLRNFFRNLSSYRKWIEKEAIAVARERLRRPTSSCKRTVFLLADAQLVKNESQKTADGILRRGGSVLFTGHPDKNSEAEKMISSGKASLISYNAHMSRFEAEQVQKNNNFERVVFFHAEE